MKLESIQLERQVAVHGQESRCYSVDPVLRCLPGCFPLKTTSVTVGFHCVPAGESEIIIYIKKTLTCGEKKVPNCSNHFTCADAAVIPQSIYDSSVDLKESAEAHLACSCTAQCA